MTDTQWPRYIVFQQAKIGEPHQYAGSVHAPDAEMALMNARDVFVRRPSCVSLWVVPANVIFTKTIESLTEELEKIESEPEKKQSYFVFQKSVHKGTYVYVGDVTAKGADAALDAALESVAKRSALAWWVLPAKAVTRSTPEDIAALFAPAASKTFRDQAFYHTVAALQQIKTQSQDTNIDER